MYYVLFRNVWDYYDQLVRSEPDLANECKGNETDK